MMTQLLAQFNIKVLPLKTVLFDTAYPKPKSEFQSELTEVRFGTSTFRLGISHHLVLLIV